MKDHKLDAESLIGSNANDWRDGEVTVAQQTEALVHATLHLAEQQRVSNLIAYLQIATNRGGIDRATVELDRQIIEALGVSA